MRKISIESVSSESEGCLENDRRPLSEQLGTTGMSVNHYSLDPGEVLVGDLHAHLDQEEVFYVIEGCLTFETTSDPAAPTTEVTVRANEAIRFAPGDYQQGRNESDRPAIVLALGAPKKSTQGRVPRTCPECTDSEYLETTMIEQQLKTRCPDCGSVFESELH